MSDPQGLVWDQLLRLGLSKTNTSLQRLSVGNEDSFQPTHF